MASEWFAVQSVGQEGLRGQRFFAWQAAAKLLVHLGDLPTEVHVFFTVIGAEKDELARLGLYAGLIEHRPQRDSGPASVARETLQRTTIARTLETEHQLRAAHFSQFVERE